MAVYFFDSSAIVKRYVSETGTAWVVSVTNPSTGNRLYVAQITGVEVISAITRQGRSGNLSTTDVTTAIGQFRYDFANEYRVIGITNMLINRAMSLAESHPLRGYDAVQLAGALEVNDQRLGLGMSPLTLVSADDDLNSVATAEGLTVDNPNSHLSAFSRGL